MLNIIVGDNTIGKTKWLDEKYNHLDPLAVIYNRTDDATLTESEYNAERLEAATEILLAESCNAENILTFINSDMKPSEGFLLLLTKMCRDRGYLLLDEPDSEILYREVPLLYSFLSCTQKTFTDIYMVTHDGSAAGIMGAEFFTIDEAGRLVKISEDEADEILNSI